MRFNPKKTMTKSELEECFLHGLGPMTQKVPVEKMEKIRNLFLQLQEEGVYLPTFILVEEQDKLEKVPFGDNISVANPMQDDGCLGIMVAGLFNSIPHFSHVMTSILSGACEGDCEKCKAEFDSEQTTN